MRAWAILIVFLLHVCTSIAAPLQGVPLRHDYNIEDYSAPPQHFSVLVDQAGVLYTANAEGVLRFDGDQWQVISLPGKKNARVLSQGRNGEIYVGAYDDIGVLRRNEKTAEWQYSSILQKTLPDKFKEMLGVVWALFPTEQGVWVHAEKHLLFFSYDYKTRSAWPIGIDVRSFFLVNQQLYARVQNKGAMRFDNGKFELLAGGERFAQLRLASMLADGKQMLLVGDDGFYRTDALGIQPVFLPNKQHAGEILKTTLPYEALRLKDQTILVGTLSGDIFLFNPDLTLRKRLPSSSFSIINMYADKEDGVWIATEGSLTRWSLPSAWSFIGADQGLGGTVTDAVWYDNKLFAATTRGIYTLQANNQGRISSEHKPWMNQETYVFDLSEHGLLMGVRTGLMVLDANNTQPRTLLQDTGEGVFGIYRSPANPQLRYALANNHVYLLMVKNAQWQIVGAIDLQGIAASEVVEIEPGTIWLGDARGAVQQFKFDHSQLKLVARKQFGEQQGLKFDPQFGTFLIKLDNQLYVVSGQKTFIWKDGRFHSFQGPPFTLVDKAYELQIEQTPLGTYALSTRQLWFRKTGQKEWQEIKIGGQTARGFRNLRYLSNGSVVVSTWTGMLVQDIQQAIPTPKPLQLGFDKVAAVKLDGGAEQQLPTRRANEKYVEVPAGHRIFFRFALASLQSPAEYRYRVIGLAEQWSPWTDRELYVRSATPGDYILEVEARTQDGSTVLPAQYRFRILPLWYEQWWTRIIGLILLAAAAGWIAYRVMSRRTARYQEQNAILEERISERTHELEQANRKLAELVTEDPLTGALNRRALEHGMTREWLRCMDQQRPLSILMIDVDHFKRYNDQHGHLDGDSMLRAIAQHLLQSVDPQRELLARYGGEEFSLLLPGVSLMAAVQRGEKLRSELAKNIPEMTISVGVASVVPNLHLEQSTLIRRADAALYVAKRNGRNRVEYDNNETR